MGNNTRLRETSAEEIGYSIERDEFAWAIKCLIDECHPGFEEKCKERIIEEYSARAEAIAEYFIDTVEPAVSADG